MARALRVAIDLRPLALASAGGIGLLVTQILEELPARGVSFIAISDRPVPEGRIPPGIESWLVSGEDGPARLRGGRIRWESFALPGLLHGLDPPPDLYHATWNHGVPGALPFPSVLSLHDLIPWRFPRFVPWPRPAFLHRALYRRAVRASAAAARVILTLSETSRRDIAALLPGAAERVAVVPCAVPRWFQAPLRRDVEAVRASYGGPYWLYLGGFDPRKGVEVLIEAVSIARRRAPLPPLVLAGARNAEAERLRARAERLGVDARFPGYVPDAGLPALYGGASLFLYPSRAEGFGIPPLLAMAAGVPIVAADGGAVPEVVGGAGRIVPAGDPSALAAAMLAVVTGEAPLDAWSEAGRERAARFTVDALAERTLAAYESAASRRPGSS